MVYRKKYFEHYGLDDDKTMDIHHIDFNRKNNCIDNLLMLPSEVHHAYHMCVGALDNLNAKRDLALVTDNSYVFKAVQNMGGVLTKLTEWMDFKKHLDIKKFNLDCIEESKSK